MNTTTIHYAIGDNSLGRTLVARSVAGLCAIMLGDDEQALKADLESAFARAQLQEDRAALGPVLLDLAALVDSPAGEFEYRLDIGGTPFQRRVWEALRAVPAGATATYADIAGRIGKRDAVRAVASACAANLLAVAIPCHRVVRRGGALSGYRWGIERKRQLLEREGRHAVPRVRQ